VAYDDVVDARGRGEKLNEVVAILFTL